MVELTVSQVAGIIAALVFVVQLLLPVILGALLTGILKPENNLTTWYLPNILTRNKRTANASTGRL